MLRSSPTVGDAAKLIGESTVTVSQIQVGEGGARSGVTALPDVATRPEVAAYTRISVPTLARWAMEGKGPKFRRAGGRVLYMRADVLAWLESLEEAS
jgi:excisionase family DNA binding protein